MKVEIERKRKFSEDTKEHFREKQDTLLWFRTFIHYRDRYIELHYRSNSNTKRRINNIQIKDHESSRTELRDFEERNIDSHLSNKNEENILKKRKKK